MNGSSVEISIGQSGEDGLDGKVVNLIATLACLVGTVGITGDILQGIDQKILQGCYLRVFATNPGYSAGRAL